MFDPMDELFKRVARFKDHAAQEMNSQVSQMNHLLQRYHHVMADKVDLVHQTSLATLETTQRLHQVIEKIVTGVSLADSTDN